MSPAGFEPTVSATEWPQTARQLGSAGFLICQRKNWKIKANTFNVQMPWRLIRFLWPHAGDAVPSGSSNCRIPTRRVLTLMDQTLRNTGTLTGVRNVDKKDIFEMAESSPPGSKRRIGSTLAVVYLPCNSLINTHKFHDKLVAQFVYIYCTKHNVLIIITPNCYMFRPHILAIIVEFQVWSARTVYMDWIYSRNM
jgi:hypothetical protein